ncbi:kelch repeat-containing protein [Myxococcus landrumensis]|uniref:Ig-like domain-containing protein n=1 Tax=Myxococcus landrumensis TaxID=2813577 RepID=A0ABX7NAA2_9BACT|nr:kelch repeat-containing protein [Myxococcus landrumus]QSQ15701.1 Ig-like domain-containing protein [Myxococcus landrumus]
MKNRPLSLLVFCLALAVIGCSEDPPPPPVEKFSISLSLVETRIAVGVKTTAKAQRVYEDGRVVDLDASSAPQWTSSAPQVASVELLADGNARVTALKVGTTTISVSTAGLIGQANLEVTPARLLALRVSPASASVLVGATQQFTVQGSFGDGTTADVTSRAAWTTSDTAQASVSGTGLATGVAAGGTVTVTATLSGVRGTAQLSITAPPRVLTGVEVTPATASVVSGTTRQFTAQARYSDNFTEDVTGSATWRTSDGVIATVSGTGLATGVTTGGPVTLTATYSGFSGTARLTVTTPPPALTSILVTPATASVVVGATRQFSAQGKYADGSSEDVTARATWTSSDGTLATVSGTGLGTGVATGGPVTVTASLAGINGTAQLSVTGWTPAGSLSTTRDQHTATRLESGQVLVAGGRNGSAPLTSVELYNPTNNSWSSIKALSNGRFSHAAVLLPGGSVLVTGGVGAYVNAEMYDLESDTWFFAGIMNGGRSGHAMTVLSSGKVLVTGGTDGTNPLPTVEVYDPATNVWTNANSMGTARTNHTAVLLPSGKVLVSGGKSGATNLTSAEVYDPATGAWTAVAAMATGHGLHAVTLLTSGKVLVSGGHTLTDAASSELYDPATNKWTTTGAMGVGRGSHTATRLSSGKVLAAGGRGSSFTNTAELYDPATSTWSATAPMVSARSGHTATLLSNGRVLVVGGENGTRQLATAEMYVP